MRSTKPLLALSLGAALIFSFGCESDEDNALLQAQECFNQVDDSTSIGGASDAVATQCLSYLQGHNSAQSNLLRCGIEFWRGGLRTNSIVAAFDDSNDAPDNQKEATLINGLSLSDTTIADTAYNYCKSANAPGMLYIAGLVRLGTYMVAAGGTNPSDIADQCALDLASCATVENGQMIIDVASAYCVGESANSDVCVAMTTVIQANPGDPLGVIQDFLNQIDP